MVRENDTVIIYRSNSPNPLGSAHFMNIGYDAQSQKYLVYNERNDSLLAASYDDLTKMYGNLFNKPLYIYGISKEG